MRPRRRRRSQHQPADRSAVPPPPKEIHEQAPHAGRGCHRGGPPRRAVVRERGDELHVRHGQAPSRHPTRQPVLRWPDHDQPHRRRRLRQGGRQQRNGAASLFRAGLRRCRSRGRHLPHRQDPRHRLAELRALHRERRKWTFAPGSGLNAQTGKRRVLLAMLTGTGGDVIDIEGTGFADAYSAYGGLLGGQVDMDNDGDTDLAISAPARIHLIGGFGDDRLAATSVFGQRATLPVTLDGGEGQDTMFGGDGSDLMLGRNGDDFVNSVGGGADVITGDAGSDTAFVDASDTVSTVEFNTFVGKLGGRTKTITGAAGDTLSMPLAWTHPKAWKQIRSIEVIAFDGAEQVGSVKLTPTGAVSANGNLSIVKDATTIAHHGKTVAAKLGIKVAKSLKGHTLSIDIAATDRDGKRQVEPAARSIRVNP